MHDQKNTFGDEGTLDALVEVEFFYLSEDGELTTLA